MEPWRVWTERIPIFRRRRRRILGSLPMLMPVWDLEDGCGAGKGWMLRTGAHEKDDCD